MSQSREAAGDAAAAYMPTCLPAREHGAPMLGAVGESFYQQALEAVSGRRNGEQVFHACEATLVPEPENGDDRNAVRVEIGGQLTAYLSRADAVRYQPLLLELRDAGYVAMCAALIVGRDVHDPDSETTNLGVCLDLAPAEDCRAALFRSADPAR